MASYSQLRSLHPNGDKVFFAFSEKQFQEGLEKINAKKEDVVNGPYGVIGRKEDVKAFLQFYIDLDKRIVQECSPQDVYEEEFWDHESAYTRDDTVALKICIELFGKERCEREITSLFSRHTRYLFFNKRTRQWQHYTYRYPIALCDAIYDECQDIAERLGLDRRKEIGKVIPLN